MIKDKKRLIVGHCQPEQHTAVGHMQAMENLTDAKAKAIKTVLPTLESFYVTLSAD